MITSRDNLKHIIDSLSGEEADEVMSLLEEHAPGLFASNPALPPVKPPTKWFRVVVNRVEHQRAVINIEVPLTEDASDARERVEQEGVDCDAFDCADANETVASVDPIAVEDINFVRDCCWHYEADEEDEGSPVAR